MSASDGQKAPDSQPVSTMPDVPRAWYLAPLLTALVLMPVLSIDLQLPAMPDIARSLGATPGAVQTSLLVYSVSFGLCHLLYGPFADRYGRRPFLIGGMALYTVASLACALAPDIDTLIAARAVQGIGAASGPLLARAVIRDVYGVAGAGRMMGFIMAWFGFGAIAFPFVGAGLTDLFGWQGPFFGSTAWGVSLTILIIWLLPETRPEEIGENTSFARRVRNYGVILRDRRFLAYFSAGVFVQMAMFAWISASAFVVIDVLGQSRLEYSAVFGTTVAAFVGMSYLSGRLARTIGTPKLTLIGAWIAAFGGAACLLVGLSFELSVLTLLLTVSIMVLGHGFTLPQSMAGSIAPFPTMAATASALFGSLQYSFNAAAVALNSIFYDGTAVPMLAIIAGATACAAVLFTLSYVRIRDDL